MAMNNKTYRRLSKIRKQPKSSYFKTKNNENHSNAICYMQTAIRTNAQCALKNHLESEKIDPKNFGTIIEKICKEFGFKALLELPSQLVEKSAVEDDDMQENYGTAIAILCPDNNGYSLLFAICQNQNVKIRVVDEQHASASIVELACSYATVLSLLPKSPSLNTVQ